MGYYIHYGENMRKTEIPKQEPRKDLGLLWGLIAVFITVYILLGAGVKILPGDPVVTRNAAANMVSELRGGETVSEAFKEFCLEIIADDENKDID